MLRYLGSRRIALAQLAGALVFSALLSACATINESITDRSLKDYFHEASAPPAAPLKHELASLEFSEYWTGIVFNGEKIGFSRLGIKPATGEPRHFRVESEASFVLRFLGYEKKVNLKAHDTVDSDLSLVRFSYDYVLDDSVMAVSGHRDGNELRVKIVTGGVPVEQRVPLEGRVFPASVIALYPVINGLKLGRRYDYRVYSGELQTVSDVEQRVVAYEGSRFFCVGAACDPAAYGEAYQPVDVSRYKASIDAGGHTVYFGGNIA